MRDTAKGYDFFGNIAVVRFSKDVENEEKKKRAERMMKENPSIKTVLEKVGKIHGRLRKITTKFLAGEKTKEVLYKENGCVFRFNIDSTYFSPRLSNERKELAKFVKKGEEVLVMFAGVAPYSIVIAKNSKAGKVTSVEINRIASKYAELNVKLNKLTNRVEVIQGDIKKILPKLEKKKIKFDVIVMSRPQLKETFLKYALMVAKKGTRIYYYGFCGKDDIENEIDKLFEEARMEGRKLKLINKKVAGEIGPFKVRFRADFIVR